MGKVAEGWVHHGSLLGLLYTNQVRLPTAKYSHIYNFIGNYMISGSDPQRAFKSPLWITENGSVKNVANS